MEGPSIFLAAEQLQPFIGQKIIGVDGNTKIGKERLLKQKIVDIFSWDKHLVFQFKDFALRVHFMLYGTFEATLQEIKITGDYPKKKKNPRLIIQCRIGHIDMYNCSLRFTEDSNAKQHYDFTIDIMSTVWDSKKALKQLKKIPDIQIGDALLDQTLFAGVGNIIKNECLFLEHLTPDRLIHTIPDKQLKSLIETTRTFCRNFYQWRKTFELKKHYQVYRQSFCKACGTKVQRKRTGIRQRISFICPHCQH